MSAKTDDLEAVRLLAETLQPFPGEDRERIIRWVREKLGMTWSAAPTVPPRTDIAPAEATRDAAPVASQTAVDIKKFVSEKAPQERRSLCSNGGLLPPIHGA